MNEFDAVLAKVEAALEEMRDIAAGQADAEKGKVVWPIKQGECPSINDAYATLYDLANCDLDLTFYDETGNEWTDTLSVAFGGTQLYPGSPPYYERRPLKELLEEHVVLNYDPEHYASNKHAQLLVRLIKAFDEEP